MDVALWIRVSTDQQESANQVPHLERFCARHGHRIVRRFTLNDSAWSGGGAEYRTAIRELLDAAWQGEYEGVVCWALDRISRDGIEAVLRLVRQLRERGAVLLSVQESWMNGSDESVELMLSIAAWMGQQESRRRSERVRAGMARARAEGKVIGGRKPGARDKRPRRTEGYVRAWEARKAAAQDGGVIPDSA